MADEKTNGTASTQGGRLEQFEIEVKPEPAPPPQPEGRCAGCRQCCQLLGEACGELKTACVNIDCKGCMKETCSVATLKKRVPIIQWLPKYNLGWLQGDIIAGLTVGLTVIPQGIAYAKVAELPPQYGLYSAFMGCFIYCFLGTSKDITLGPTAIMSLMVAEFGAAHGDPTIAIVLALGAGIIQVLMGLLNIGFLVEFISHPVINSFTTAAAITIAFGQIKNWLGLHKIPREFLHQFYETFKKIPETRIWDFVLGLICMILLFAMKKMKDIKWNNQTPSVPVMIIRKIIWLCGTARNAIVVVLASGAAAIFMMYDMTPFTLTEKIDSRLPEFKPPSFTIHNGNETIGPGGVISTIGSGFAIIPIIGLIETIAIGKAFARKNHYKIDTNQELIAIGLSNIVGSFVSSYPVTGSFSRTAINSQSGVRTPAGGIFTGALVLIALAFLTPLFSYIPDACLAAIIILAVLDMVDFSLIIQLWRVNRLDVVPWVFCFIFSFLTGIEYGIIIGVAVNLLILLYPYAKPGIKVAKENRNSVVTAPTSVSQDDVVVIKFAEGLHFPGIEYVVQRVLDESSDNEIIERHVSEADTSPMRNVILDMTYVHGLDYTSAHGWQGVISDLFLNDRAVIFANLRPDLLETMKRCNLKHFRYAATVEEAKASIYETSGTSNEENELDDTNPRRSLLSKEQLSGANGGTDEGGYGSTSKPPHNLTDDGSLNIQVDNEDEE